MGLLSRLGLTLSANSYAGVLKGLSIFPLIIVLSGRTIVYFVKHPISNQLIDVMPVPVEKVPALCIVFMFLMTSMSGLAVILILNLIAGGYDNGHPRVVKGPALADTYPVLFRLQSAHNNSFEALSMATACFWVASTHLLDPTLFAKLALYALASRVLYVLVR